VKEVWLTLWRSKMYNVPVFLEHVHLFNGLDGLDVEFLERGLEFLVVGAGGFVNFFCFATGCAFSSAMG
jgi:hypothetical protein